MYGSSGGSVIRLNNHLHCISKPCMWDQLRLWWGCADEQAHPCLHWLCTQFTRSDECFVIIYKINLSTANFISSKLRITVSHLTHIRIKSFAFKYKM